MQLLVNFLEMILRRKESDSEFAGNFLGHITIRQQPQDLFLARCEPSAVEALSVRCFRNDCTTLMATSGVIGAPPALTSLMASIKRSGGVRLSK